MDGQSRVAMLSVIVENSDSVDLLNAVLHDYSDYIIGRMGIPYREKHINIICIALDAPQDVISSLAGKVGNINGIRAKTVLSHVGGHE